MTRQHIHQRAADAVRFGEQVATVATLFLVILALGFVALRADDIRAHRLGVDVETVLELDATDWRDAEARIAAARAAQVNECGARCIARIGDGVEQWGEQL